MDHMGDLPAFFMDGPPNNRSVPLKVWPGGGRTRPEWGTKAAMDHMQKMWAWMNGTLVGTIDMRHLNTVDIDECVTDFPSLWHTMRMKG